MVDTALFIYTKDASFNMSCSPGVQNKKFDVMFFDFSFKKDCNPIKEILVRTQHDKRRANWKYMIFSDAREGYDESDIEKISSALHKKGGFVAGSKKDVSKFHTLRVFIQRIVFALSGAGKCSLPDGIFGISQTLLPIIERSPGVGNEYSVNIMFNSLYAPSALSCVLISKKLIDKDCFANELKTVWYIFKASRSLKYMFSSFFAFLIDYIMLLILNSVIPVASFEIAAFLAWFISSVVNFTVNREFVFKTKAPLSLAIPEYYGLAGIVFVLKTYVLIEILTRILAIPLFISKLGAEITFFIFNYILQKKVIFRKREH